MELRRLQHFLAVIDHGSFGRAASALGITQSGLTKSIQILEEECGGALFNRHQKGAALNDLGRTLAMHARNIENSVHAAEIDIASKTTDKEWTIRIGADPAITEHVLAPVLLELTRSVPKLRIQCHGEANTIDLLKLLKAGELDLVLGPEPEEADAATLGFLHLRSYQQCVVLREGHPLTDKAEISMEDLCAQQWALPAKGTLYRARLEAFLASRGKRLRAPTIESNSVRLRFTMVENTDMLTIATGYALEWVHSDRLRILDMPFKWVRRVGLINRRDEHFSDIANLLITTLRESFEAEVPVDGEG